MKKIELLAPAGDRESFIAAVQNGADAIYLGGTLFSARANAKNFNDEDLQWAVSYAHLYGVKVYVTINTLYKDKEINALTSYVTKLYELQVDALIVQDIGLFDLIRTFYPDFEIHISTQASVMNSYGTRYFEENGAHRVVLARENTLEEIQNICRQTNLEIEVFVHGAMCVCYSGQCLMSSMIGKRSGNRGQCAQPCRLQYQLLKDGQSLPEKHPYLLSPKDIMTIEYLGELIEAGVSSLKIEGRMKRPEYVASVTRAYREAIDAYYQNKKIDFQPYIQDMSAMFNRNYTSGYLHHDLKIVDGDYPGHKGYIIGEVVYYHKKQKRVGIRLTQPLLQGDSIVFEDIDKGRPVNKIYHKHKLVKTGQPQDIIEIEFDYYVDRGLVRKTLDKQVVERMQKTYQIPTRKIEIDMSFEAKIGKKAKLKIQKEDHSVIVESSQDVEIAHQTPLDDNRIAQQLSKLGSTPYIINNLYIDSDEKISMPIKDINEMRRKACNQFIEILSHQKIHHQIIHDIPQLTIHQSLFHSQLYVCVHSLQQLEAVLQYPVEVIIYPYQKDIEMAYQMCLKYHKKMVMMTSPVIKDDEIKDILHSKIYNDIQTILVNDYGTYRAFQKKELIIGHGLNIHNSYAAHHYHELFLTSLEMSAQEIKNLKTDLSKCIVQVFGKTTNMISDYCPISQYYFGYQNKHCQMCQQGHFALKDRKKEVFDIMVDEHCRMHLLNAHTLFYDQWKQLPVGGYLINLTHEDSQKIQIIMEHFIFQSSPDKIRQIAKLTSGYFKE